MRWARRSRDAFDAGGEHAAGAALFGIVQGALTRTCASESAEALTAHRLRRLRDRRAGGGRGAGGDVRACSISRRASCPADAPRYLMGVGTPDDIVGAVARGIDMFDCVLPTRTGRNGQAFTCGRPDQHPQRRAIAEDAAPARRRAALPGLRALFERAYLHHSCKAGEILGAMLMTEHNLWFYQQLMRRCAMRFATGCFAAFAGDFRRNYAG